MSRFFVESNMVGNENIIIDSLDDVKHISKVLRLKVGSKIFISDGSNWEYECEIIEITKTIVESKIIDKQKFAREPKIRVTLFQGIPKHGKMDLVVQKAVELGVYKIVPVFMKRTIINDEGGFSKKIKRFNAISYEAAKQCQRGLIPQITEAIKFEVALDILKTMDTIIFPYENEENLTLKDFLRGLENEIRDVGIIVGPEGGFSDEEATMLKNIGAPGCSLGKTILRTETASITAIAMTMYELEL